MRFFEEGSWTEASDFVKAAYDSSKSLGVSPRDRAGMELTTCIGLLVNSVPTTIWLLYRLISDPSLLESVHDELLSELSLPEHPANDSVQTIRLSTATLKSHCSLLNSVFRETLRYYSSSLTARIVQEDTILDDHYLLRQDSLVVTPSIVMHRQKTLWGNEASDFVPTRFLNSSPLASPRSTSTPSTPRSGSPAPASSREAPPSPRQPRPPGGDAFRAFGAGTTLCPGRHFATSQVLAFVAMFVLQFEVTPVVEDDKEGSKGWWRRKGGKGIWSEGAQAPRSVNFTNSIVPPPENMPVRIKPRSGWEGVSWECV